MSLMGESTGVSFIDARTGVPGPKISEHPQVVERVYSMEWRRLSRHFGRSGP